MDVLIEVISAWMVQISEVLALMSMICVTLGWMFPIS